MNSRIIRVEKTESTNVQIKSLNANKDLDEGTVVWADFQSAGKGQKGNSWQSDDKKNILFSTILYPHFILAGEQFIISQIVSIGIKNILDQYVDGISIKWPNDIYWQDKKICGILIENDLFEDKILQSIIGIGININQEAFDEKAPNAISLTQITGICCDRESILIKIIAEIIALYEMAKTDKNSLVAKYKQNLYRKTGFFTYKDKYGTFSAKIEDIEPSGLLVLKTDKQELKTFAFKEVIFL